MAVKEIEHRLNQVEQSLSDRVAKLEQQMSQLVPPQPGQPTDGHPAWWKQVVGVFRDDPEFEEAMRLGRAYRESLTWETESDEAPE